MWSYLYRRSPSREKSSTQCGLGYDTILPDTLLLARRVDAQGDDPALNSVDRVKDRDLMVWKCVEQYSKGRPNEDSKSRMPVVPDDLSDTGLHAHGYF